MLTEEGNEKNIDRFIEKLFNFELLNINQIMFICEKVY
jgi:hypothetical protein